MKKKDSENSPYSYSLRKPSLVARKILRIDTVLFRAEKKRTFDVIVRNENCYVVEYVLYPFDIRHHQ